MLDRLYRAWPRIVQRFNGRWLRSAIFWNRVSTEFTHVPDPWVELTDPDRMTYRELEALPEVIRGELRDVLRHPDRRADAQWLLQYHGEGADELASLIDTARSSPSERRMILRMIDHIDGRT